MPDVWRLPCRGWSTSGTPGAPVGGDYGPEQQQGGLLGFLLSVLLWGKLMVEGFAGETSGESGRELIDRAERRSGDVGVERIEDPTSLRQQIHGAVSSVRRELCSTLPAGPYRPSVLRSSWEDDVGLLRSGIAGMVIYQADAVRTPEILRYLTEFSTAGAHIRVARRVTHRMMIVDRRLVFVAVDPDTLKPPYLLIREPALVRSFCSQFASTWKVAHTVGIGPEDSLADESVREILQILSSGVTDDAAARELGVSDRTIRRRVAAVLDLLGASSRFEAGVKATQAGWL